VIPGGPDRYFDANAFLAPANGTYGNVGRDVLAGPGSSAVDFSLANPVLKIDAGRVTSPTAARARWLCHT